jgi:TRAP-type C4-dicarboxylate transport system permease small subunit
VEYTPPPSRRDPVKQGVLALGMAMMVVAASLQVGARYFFDRPLAWSEEAVRYVMIWTALLAAAWSVRDREHITVDLVMAHLPARGRRVLDVIRNLLVTVFCLVLLPVAIRVTGDVHSQLGVAIEIPLSIIFASLPIALVLMAWWSLRLALRTLRQPSPE